MGWNSTASRSPSIAVAQVVSEAGLAVGRGLVDRTGEGDPLLAAARVQHRVLGRLHEPMPVAAMLRIDGDADAHVDAGAEALDRERRRHRLRDPLRLGDRMVGRIELGQQGREVAAAHARERVGAAQQPLQAGAGLLDQLVAEGFAHRLPDGLEHVEVDDEHRKRPLAALGGQDRLVDPVIEHRPVV